MMDGRCVVSAVSLLVCVFFCLFQKNRQSLTLRQSDLEAAIVMSRKFRNDSTS